MLWTGAQALRAVPSSEVLLEQAGSSAGTGSITMLSSAACVGPFPGDLVKVVHGLNLPAFTPDVPLMSESCRTVIVLPLKSD